MGILDDAIRQHLELKRQHGAPEEELQRQEEEALGPARREVAPADTAGGDGEVELEDAADEAPDAAPAALADAGPEGDEGPAADAARATEAPAAETPATELEAEPDPEPHEQATVLQEPESKLEEPESALDAPESALHEPESALHEPPAEPHPTAPYDAAADMPELDQEDEVPAGEALEQPGPAEDEAPAREAFDHPDDEDDDLFADEEDDEPEAHQGHEETSEDVLEDTPDFLQETPEHDRLWFEQKPPRDFDFD